MITLQKVNAKNVWELLALNVAPSQKNFVATNTESIVEAYTTVAAGGVAMPFGIYDDDLPVGFLMIGYGADDWEEHPDIAEGNYSIWRLMIDEKYQHRGYGKTALAYALAYIRTFPCGRAPICYLSYEPDNAVAKKLYHSFGFVETGEFDGGEVIAALPLI